MSNSVYGIALSGLNVARAGLSVTSNNIANVNTQGYSRQSLQQNQRESSFLGGNYFGQGVDVTSVRRSYSQIISQQEQRATSDAAYYQAKFDQVSRLDGVLGDDASGLSSALSDFFNSAQVLSTSPTDLSARQNFLSAASSLSSRFNSINGVMDELRAATNLKVEDTVQKINDAAAQIVNLNVRITAANSQSFQSSPPNDLLDQRDELIKELSAQVQLTSVPLEDGSINLFLANGQPLVVKGQDFPVTTSVDPTDPSNLLVGSNVADSSSPTGTT
ncbi:MAG: flagellar hook-associated protein FlgK, partial [Limnobacter sp.]|nr:flagellar hook-associated protein FlgK [Limnobacter sp.]